MEKKEDLGLPKPRLIKESIETLCQPPPLEKYTEAPSSSSSNGHVELKLSLKLPSILLRSFLILLLILSLSAVFYKFFWQQRNSASTSQTLTFFERAFS